MKITNCRMCGSENLKEWLDLGHQPHSDQFKLSNEIEEITYPLKVSVCLDCGLNQLTYLVAKEELYTKDYLYEASITKTADKHWSELADDVVKRTGIKSGYSLDIGGNDGTLALKFKEKGFNAWNIDPCIEVCQISSDKNISTVPDFFPSEKLIIIGIQFNIITGTNVFAHVHDLDAFIEAVKGHLAFNGVFVFESPYFGEFLKGLEYDTVYHQHLSYLSLKPLIPFLEKHGMEIFDVVFTPLHGGAFRCYIARKGERNINPSVNLALQAETWTYKDLEDFARKVKENRQRIYDYFSKKYKEGKSIVCVSAPAKGQTFLNYTGIGRFISYMTDKSKLKQGRFTPGTFIPIVSDHELIEQQPDYAIILAWNFKDEIIKNNPEYKGRWVTCIPKLYVSRRTR